MLQKREDELRELRHASRLSKKVTIDFAGRKILEDENPLAEYHSRWAGGLGAGGLRAGGLRAGGLGEQEQSNQKGFPSKEKNNDPMRKALAQTLGLELHNPQQLYEAVV